MTLTRRQMLKSAHAAALSFAALAQFGPRALAFSANEGLPLVPDPGGVLDLPRGFRYTLLSQTGGTMSDGFIRPARPDGMACFAHPESPRKCILTRNHENFPDAVDGGAFGEGDELAGRLDAGQIYDHQLDGRPFLGAVTTVVYDLDQRRVEREFLSLAGTTANCAGGATPWGSWLSCEEAMLKAPDEAGRDHGYVFEVPISATGPVEPVPLKAMGRFVHEAAAVDPETGIVYLTEDNMAGLFYRFVPKEKGVLAKGGRLQALVLRDWRSGDTRNFPRDWGGAGNVVESGASFDVDWIDLDDVESPNADLTLRGHAAGAAYFCRGEGMAYGRQPGQPGAIHFNCTQGGVVRAGQVWRYTPETAKLDLLYESPSSDVLDLCDNLAYAPWGDLILCEDGLGDQYLRGLGADGRIYDLARNAHPDQGEFCGACFSPDGSVLFVNIQEPGFTLAIEGPWNALAARAADLGPMA